MIGEFRLYTPFGRAIDPETGAELSLAPTPNLGFTGHEVVDSYGLINMNGRQYDPLIGRFTTADPIVQAPAFSQSLNRYSYVWNSPLGLVDPSGFEIDDGLWHCSGGFCQRGDSIGYDSDGAEVIVITGQFVQDQGEYVSSAGIDYGGGAVQDVMVEPNSGRSRYGTGIDVALIVQQGQYNQESVDRAVEEDMEGAPAAFWDVIAETVADFYSNPCGGCDNDGALDRPSTGAGTDGRSQINRSEGGVNLPKRNHSVKHKNRKSAKEAAQHAHGGKPKPQPKKTAPRAKRDAFEESQKSAKPESHPQSPHPEPHFHDSNKRKAKSNVHHTY